MRKTNLIYHNRMHFYATFPITATSDFPGLLSVKLFSTSSVLQTDEDTDSESKPEDIEKIKTILDEMRIRLDKLEEVRFSNRINKEVLAKARDLTEYIQNHNEMLLYYLGGEMQYNHPETVDQVNNKVIDMIERSRHYEDEALQIYFEPKEGVYPDREALLVLNKLSRMVREHLMFCRDKVYGTPDEPTESMSPFLEYNKESFKSIERQRDYYLNENSLVYIREDAKRMRLEEAERELMEKQPKFDETKSIYDKLVEARGGKKVKFVDDVPKDLSSGTTTPKDDVSKDSTSGTTTPKDDVSKDSTSDTTTPKDDLPKDLSSSSVIIPKDKGKGKAKESLIDDFADLSIEMPDYIDPDG